MSRSHPSPSPLPSIFRVLVPREATGTFNSYIHINFLVFNISSRIIRILSWANILRTMADVPYFC
jgi:hypothetical protein